MSRHSEYKQTRPAGWRSALAAAVLLGVGMLIGSVTSSPRAAWGEVQPQPQPPMFQSGSQISVPILKDIAATLHQMDARLARLETIARQMEKRSN